MVEMTLKEDLIIPRTEGRAVEVRKGQTVKIIAVDGRQVADTTFINLHDKREGYHAGQTVALNMLAGTGSMRHVTHLYSKPPRENVMLTVVEDLGGVHFAWNGGRCSRMVYAIRDGINTSRRTCQDNLAEAIEPWGFTGDDVPDVFNIFQDVDVIDERTLVFKPAVVERGGFISLRAEMDVLVAVSACPSEVSATNEFNPKRLQVQVWTPHLGVGGGI